MEKAPRTGREVEKGLERLEREAREEGSFWG